MAKTDSNVYDASKITILEGLEAVRKRPAMYIGDSGVDGLHHLIKEVVDNSIDEALAGVCTRIDLVLNDDGSVSITDNGRGIPVDIHPIKKISALEVIMTSLHSGGKFDNSSYKVSGGLHGVGIAVVNALSIRTIIEVKRDGKLWRQEYSKGVPKHPVKEVGTSEGTGTIVTFLPDPEIFDTTIFNFKNILQRYRQQAYLTAGLTFTLKDNRLERPESDQLTPREYTYHFEGGIKSYVTSLNRRQKVINQNIFYVNKEEENVNVEVAVQYTRDLQERVLCFANNIINPEGGTHLSGFRIALTKSINDYFASIATEKEKTLKFTGDDTREGLTAIISVKVPNPQYEGQTKIKLNNPEVTQIVRKVVEDSLKMYLEESPNEARAIVSRAVIANKARKAAKAAREAVIRKGAFEGGTLPGKLADCSSRNPEECELYIVEGDSAGGSAKQGRDRRTQAIFPLRGKPLNSEKYRIDRIFSNQEIKDLVVAIGAGVGETFDPSKVRYHKVILMNDADVDGEHITTLMLTLFFRHMKEVIKNGFLYVAQPPLFKVEVSNDEFYWVLDEATRDKKVVELKAEGKEIKGIQRFKGLGEMQPEQLWNTTMDPAQRVLKKINIEDAEEADKVFDMLMGSEVPPRKKFIQTYSTTAELDI